MRILQIDNDVRGEIRKVRGYAVEHIVDGDRLALIKAGKLLPVGDNPDHVVHIHDGYRAVYSVDKHPHTGDLYHHLSVSIDRNDAYPHEEAVGTILKEFGMKHWRLADRCWSEDEVCAFNVIQKMVKDEDKETKKDDSRGVR
jgi:hypothetical protein